MLLGEILVTKGYCTEDDISKALSIQESYGGKIGNILINMGAITEEQLIRALSEQFEIPFVDSVEEFDIVNNTGLDEQLFSLNNAYPVLEDENSITLVTNNPLNLEFFSLIEQITGKQVKLLLTTEENLRYLATLIETSPVIEEQIESLDEEIEKLKELALEAPVIKLVNSILTKAVEQKASDIHFESLKTGMRIRFRIDGILRTVDTVPNSLKLAVITRLKLMSGMNISENRLPQDGRISVRIAGRELDIRASSVPTQHGESFVLRLLGREDITYSLESLGFYPDHLKTLKEIIAKTNGIFLTTGPTGSGKTTTLYSILNELNSDAVKIITIEDPVEYELKGINQINVRPDIGYTFATALRSILRQDPDIIMVGEIRDVETAEIAIQSALTGHLVLSTLHTNSALSSITRLLDMGVEFFLIKASIVGLMAQRLVRTLCPYCAEPYAIPDEILEVYNINNLLKEFSFVSYNPKLAKGCEHCGYTGYKGRTVIAEIIPFTEHVATKFEENRNFDNPNELGYRTMFQDGLLKFIEGKTSLEEVLRVAG